MDINPNIETDAKRLDRLLKNRGTDTDIASVVYELEPTRYTYLGEHVWLDATNTRDPNGLAVWDDLQTWFGKRLVERGCYWQTEACNADPTSDTYYNCSRNAMIYMDIFQRLHKNTYRKQLLEELKIYYIDKK